VLIDTNIHISASLSCTAITYQAYIKAVTAPYQGLVSDQNIGELRRIYNRKFLDKISALKRFLALSHGG
jgi:predicted nucleic acid-binding protein